MPGRLLVALLLAVPAPGIAGDGTPRAARLAAEASTRLDEGDLERALKLARRAVRADDGSATAHYLVGAALEAMALAETDPERAARYRAEARVEMARTMELSPDGLIGSIAGLYVASGEAWLTLPEPECPAAGHAAMGVAERAFGARDAATALAAYADAVKACPENASWWVYYGDGWFMGGDLERAATMYGEALQREPCHWMAHRFMADARMRQGRVTEAFDHLLTAVSCNPDYDPGWAHLQTVLDAMRLPLDLPRVEKAQILLEVSLAPEDGAAGEAALAGRIWRAYAEARRQLEAAAPDASALDREREAVRTAMSQVEFRLSGQDFTDPGLQVWGLLSEADLEGLLDPAIFVFLHDAGLRDDFLGWREEHLDLMKAYVVQRLVRLGEEDPAPPEATGEDTNKPSRLK